MKKNKSKKQPLSNQNLSSRVPNSFHFDVQRTTRMQVQQPKKGKGSYNRSKLKKGDYD